MMQKTVNRLTIAVAIAMFFAAIFVLYRELENTRLIDVIANFEALPKARVTLALAFTAASYLLLTGYDFLALSYADHKLRSRETLFASFISFTFSNNLGFALMSGELGSLLDLYRIRSPPRRDRGSRRVLHPHLCARCHDRRRADAFARSRRHVIHPQPATTASAGCGDCDACGGRRLSRRSRRPARADRSVALSSAATLARVRAYAISVASLDQALAAGVVYVLLPPDTQITFHAISRCLCHRYADFFIEPCARRTGGIRNDGCRVGAQYVESGLARLPHRLSLNLFRVAACVGDPSGCDLRDAALGARVGLASATAQRPDQKRQTRSRPSSSMTVADLLSMALAGPPSVH